MKEEYYINKLQGAIKLEIFLDNLLDKIMKKNIISNITDRSRNNYKK